MASSLSNINFLIFLLLLSCSIVAGAFDGKLMSRICSENLFHIGSIYHYAVGDIMNALIAHTSKSPELDYYCKGTEKGGVYERDVTLFGHGVCTSSLSPQDCHDCIVYADSEMFKECTHSEGAQIQLTDCRLRYENYEFRNDGKVLSVVATC